MAISRRKFVKAGALVFLAAGIPTVAPGATNSKSSAAGTSPAPTMPTPPPHGAAAGSLRSFSLATFTPHLNSSFRIHAEQGATDIKLVKALDLKANNSEAHRMAAGECFSLMFLGFGRESLEQETYTVEHGSLGKFEMFLVPILEKNRGTQHYQAIFTRL